LVAEHPLYQVDAFTAVPFTGNPAAVMPLEAGGSWPSDDWMQAVADENNLSETAFLLATPREPAWDLRWFTPRAEVDLCGHATLASAHVLWQTGRLATDQMACFNTRSGLLTATRSADGWVEMELPALPADETTPPAGLVDALGAPPVVAIARSRFDLLVELDTAAEVMALRPDMSALRRLATRGIIVTAPTSGEHHFVSRFFAPSVGIDEDPVTGSAHCALAPWWASKLGVDELRARQVSRRGGELRLRLVGSERVVVAGQAVTVLEGRLLPR
jgi:PhzF family phenazine biosynthesis protein